MTWLQLQQRLWAYSYIPLAPSAGPIVKSPIKERIGQTWILYTEQLLHLLIIPGVRLPSFTGLIFTGSLCIRS